MISENSSRALVEPTELAPPSQRPRPPILSTTTTGTGDRTEEEGKAALNGTQTSSKARQARQSCQDSGTGGASTNCNASERGRLPGIDGQERSRERKRSVVPPKPSPPPVATSSGAKRTPPVPVRRFCVQPYTPYAVDTAGMNRSPPMARTTPKTDASPSSSSSSASSSPASVPRSEGAEQAPVPPPRKRRHTPKSPGASRSALVTKPGPPATAALLQPAAGEPVKPPVASPRRKSGSVDNREDNSSLDGGVCVKDGAKNPDIEPKFDISVSESEQERDVAKSSTEHDQRKETKSVLLDEISRSDAPCVQGTDNTRDNPPPTTENNTPTNKSLNTRPPLPPRHRKKARATGDNSPSPAPSPKPSRQRILPQIPRQAIERKGMEQQRNSSGSTTTTNSETQNSTTEINSSADKEGKDKHEDKSSMVGREVGECKQPIDQKNTAQLDDRDILFVNGAPPIASRRRNTLASKPALRPKPTPPPKSQALRRYSQQLKPPVPRPRSSIPSPQRDISSKGGVPNSSNSAISSHDSSPSRTLQPSMRNLANSTPSLLSAMSEANAESNMSGLGTTMTGSVFLTDRKAGSESPSHSHGGESTSHTVEGVVASNERRATMPSPSHMATAHVSPSHMTGHVSSPSHMTDHVSSPSHMTDHVSSPSHVTDHVSSPSHVEGERRGSVESPSRVRVLPTPQPRNNTTTMTRIPLKKEELEHAKSLLNISSLSCSPARHLPGATPPAPPSRHRVPKSSSVSDILDAGDEDSSTSGSPRQGTGLARELVEELKGVTGDGMSGEGDRVRGGDIERPESQQSHRSSSRKRDAKTARLNFARAVSVGDIALLETGPISTGRASDASSYTSSDGRSSVMSSEHHPLLERARQLSRVRKWCDQPEVKEAGIVPNMAKEQLLLQEAIFEIITSEASYHLNLATLIDRFMDDPKLDPNSLEPVLDRTQHSTIFSNVKEIRRISARFLEEILALFNEDVLMRKIFPVLEDYAANRFVCYERYCASQSHRLKELKECTHVVDYCPLNRLSVNSIATSPTHTLDNTSNLSDDSYTMSGAEWTVAVSGEEHGFLVTLHESATAVVGGKAGGGGVTPDGSYIFVARSEAEKSKWMDILREKTTQEVASTPTSLTGRNLTLLTRTRKREVPSKKYWWKQPEVERSGVVKALSQLQLELQEAMFEVMTSEEEHLAAMETLVNHYMCDSGLDPSLPEQQRVLGTEEYNDIFRYVNDVYLISEGLLKTLRARQRENVVVDTICDVILLCVERQFQGYISYCTNLPNSLDQLDTSIEKNESFRGYLKQLEEDQRPLRSLLKAPMDRVTQLPQLMKVVLRKTSTSDLNHCLVETTLRALEKVERLCTTGQQKVERIKELYSLESQLDFGSTKPFSVASVGRSLLMQGSITKLKVSQWFGKAVRKKSTYLIVLSDHLLITKRADNVMKVIDTSPLDRILVEEVEPHSLDHTPYTPAEDAMATARWAVSKAGENHAFLVSLPDVKRNYTFVASSERERQKWIDSLSIQNRNFMSFDEETDSSLTWEYFYMEAATDYTPASDGREPEHLDMKRGDLLRVYRANNEWCEGLRVHDLYWGRFPTKHLCHAPPGRREGEGPEAGLGEFLVQATHDFAGSESGELPLDKGDVIKVARQLAGWCEGKKLHGNQWGWFPNTHAESISTSRSSSLASTRPTLTSHHPTPSPSHSQTSHSSLLSDLLLPQTPT